MGWSDRTRPGAAERKQVELDARPVAVVVIDGSVEAGGVRGLTTVRALQGRDQQDCHDDE